jgi:ribosomal protein S6E (S10)
VPSPSAYSPPSALGYANGAAAPAPERCAASFSHHPASAASYILHITGGNDEQGFPMKQGVLLWHQAAALEQPLVTLTCANTAPAAPASASPRPCGWIVGPNIAVLSVVLVKQGQDRGADG